MIIDIERAKFEFLKYTQNYDLSNDNIERKQQHSLRVMEISKDISIEIGLSKTDVELAQLIGLLHDVARFEQYTQYKTFSDTNSFDHGDYGLLILKKDIRNYIEIDEYDDIIKKAIRNHNKFELEPGLTQREELFAKIIRDADKLDILYEATDMFWKNEIESIENSKIEDVIYKSIKEHRQFKRGKTVYKNINSVLLIIAFIFDINFKYSFQVIQRNGYINKILDRFEIKDSNTKDKIEELRDVANKYIQDKAK